MKWPKVLLGEVLNPVERPEVPIVGSVYRQIGVKLWGEGAYERETIDGGQTRYRTFSKVETNDIIVNKIWGPGWKRGCCSRKAFRLLFIK